MTHMSSGAYHPGDSMMHRLDALVKLICFLLLLLAILTTDTPAGYMAMLLFTTAAAYLARIDSKRAMSSIRQFWWLLALVVLSNFAFYSPEETFGAWWVFTPSVRGLYKGISIALRVVMIIVISGTLLSTTSSLKLLEALETMLSPLIKIGIPAGRLVTVLRLSTRLLPSLFDDAEFIRRSQKARGVNFVSKGFFSKAETAMPLVLPLLINAFRRADDLSMVMECRGFRPGQNAFSAAKPAFAAGDWAAILVCGAVCAMQIMVL